MSLTLGTDGWRGIIARDCTFEEIRGIAAALARFLASHAVPGETDRTVVGYDTRFFSPEFAQAASEVLARAGIGVLLSDRPIPTPAVSFHVRRLGLAAGIAITASHNPGQYNGLKIKAHFGGSAPPEMYSAVAAELGRPPIEGTRTALVERADLEGPYRRNLEDAIDTRALRRAGLAVLADAMHGAAGALVSEVARGGSTRVVPFRADRDPLFGGVNPEPIAPNLGAAAEAIRAGALDLAVATDGDADRLGVLDRRGEFVSPHRILGLLLLHAYRRRGLSGAIARTFSTSLLIDRIGRALGVPVLETPIGFKHIAERMNRGEVAAGGEESGGYAFAFYLPERDGVFCALLLLESLAAAGRDLDGALADLEREFGSFAYGRRDVYLSLPLIEQFLDWTRESPPERIAGERVTGMSGLDGVKLLLGERGWLLHRLSGTEPMIRLYCEHEDQTIVDRILDAAQRRLSEFTGRRQDGTTS